MSSASLVTGGCGFLGDHLVKLLLDRNEGVRVLDLEPPEVRRDGVEYVRGDILDREVVEGAVEEVDVVYHLAAKAGLWSPDSAEFERTNRAGTRQVLLAARSAGVRRVVHCSSEVVLVGKDRPAAGSSVDEDHRLSRGELLGPHPVGKWAAEDEVFSAVAGGQDVVVVNPTVPVGPGDRNLTPPSRMLLGYLNGRYPAFLESILNLVDVRDAAEGHLRAAERGRPGERYLLAGANLRMSELLALLERVTGLGMPRIRIPYAVAWLTAALGEAKARVTGVPPAAPLTGVRLAGRALRFTNRKARTELGMEFRPPGESLKDAVEWFRDRGLLERPSSGEE